jgi:hypothetical protein
MQIADCGLEKPRMLLSASASSDRVEFTHDEK